MRRLGKSRFLICFQIMKFKKLCMTNGSLFEVGTFFFGTLYYIMSKVGSNAARSLHYFRQT